MFLERGSTIRTTWQVYFERVKESVGVSGVEYVYPRIGIDLMEGDEFWVKTKRSFNTVEGMFYTGQRIRVLRMLS